MSMSPSLLAACQDLLRIPAADTTFNVRLEAAYQRALTDLTRETDFFAYIQSVPTVAGRSLHTAASGTTRILAVFHQRALRLVPSRSLDLLARWETPDTTPQTWSQDKFPGAPSPLVFSVNPAPAETTDVGLTVLRIGIPPGDLPPRQFFPYLLFKTVSLFCLEDTEERDMLAGNFWDALAGIWRELLMR